MSNQIGQGSLGFGHKEDPQGPPFSLNSADNGLSVDPISFRVVLGNDNTFAFGGSAQLLNSREVYLAGFTINFLSDPGAVQGLVQIDNQIVIVMDFGTGNSVKMQSGPAAADLIVSGAAANPSVQLLTNSIATDFVIRNNSGQYVITDAANKRFFLIDQVNKQWFMGDIDAVGNRVTISIDDPSQQVGITRGTDGMALFDMSNFNVAIGDLGGAVSGLQWEIDVSNQRFNLRNTALNAKYAVNNNDGASGTFLSADAKTITVEGGIITSIV